MSYGITTEGFTPKDLITIMGEVINRARELIPRIDVHSSSFNYMEFKVVCERLGSLWSVMEECFTQLGIHTATGQYLDMIGEDLGFPRGEAERAIGTLDITGDPDGTVLPIGTIFSTNEGTEFETTESITLPIYVQMTRGTGSSDSIASPNSDITIDFISQFSDGTGIYASSTYSFANDVLTWITSPPAGTTYYIWLSDAVTVEVSVQAVEAGRSGIVAANTITVDGSGTSSIQSLTNDSETRGGTDQESDASYRDRLISLVHRNWVLATIKGYVDAVSGVRSSKVYQNEGTDQYSPSNWTSGTYDGTEQIDANAEVGQTYSSGNRVLTLSAVSVKGRKVGAPNPLKCEVYYWKGDWTSTLASTLMTDGEFRQQDVDPNDPFGYQEIKIPVNFAGLDSSLTYLIRLYQDTGDGSGYWELQYNNGNPYSDGEMYFGTGASSVSAQSGQDLWFKTYWRGAAFTSRLAVETGETFADVQDDVESAIDDQGVKAIGITSVVSQATTVRINVEGTIYVESGYSFDTVSGDIEINIRNYLNSLTIGDDIYYSTIQYLIRSTDGVSRFYDIQIRRDNLSLQESDITILDEEVATLDDGTYGAGTSFDQGG